jgi:hypothetical protein
MNTQIDIFGGLPQPKTNQQEVLLQLILNGYCTFKDFAYMQGFRTRISDLKQLGLILETKKLTGINKYKNTYVYHKHILDPKHLEYAKDLYNKLFLVKK